MTANSKILSTTVFGKSSGLSATDQALKDTTTQEEFISQTGTFNLLTKLPIVPSNQKYMKD